MKTIKKFFSVMALIGAMLTVSTSSHAQREQCVKVYERGEIIEMDDYFVELRPNGIGGASAYIYDMLGDLDGWFDYYTVDNGTRRFNIYVDGKKVGSYKYGKTEDIYWYNPDTDRTYFYPDTPTGKIGQNIYITTHSGNGGGGYLPFK